MSACSQSTAWQSVATFALPRQRPFGRYLPESGLILLTLSFVDFDPDVWTGCISQLRTCGIAELADMYPAYLSARGPWP
jgi:hypothetical protein